MNTTDYFQSFGLIDNKSLRYFLIDFCLNSGCTLENITFDELSNLIVRKGLGDFVFNLVKLEKNEAIKAFNELISSL